MSSRSTPRKRWKNKIEGVVILEAVIDDQGKVRTLRIISSPSQLLNDAALPP